MTTHDTLLPCPFCGGGAELIDNAYNCVGWNTNYYSAYARCTECGAEGRHIKLTECYGPPDGTVDDAIAAWNRRADADGRRMSEPTTNDIEPTTSASDELRRLLDERGVEWWEGEDERKTHWRSNGLTWEYFNTENGDAWLGFLGACESDISPEQAVEAMLGRGECHDVGDPCDFWCSGCGARMFIDTGETYTMIDSLGNIIEQPNFCPNCGRKIKED